MKGANSGHAVSAPIRALSLSGGAALALLLLLLPQPVAAQSGERPSITVAPILSAEATSQVSLAIVVGPAAAIPPRSFIRLHGLPPVAALSDAYSIAPGTWAVALAALPNLRIILPAGVSGRSEILITLVAVDGTVLAEAKSVLAVAPPRPPSIARPAPTPPPVVSVLRAGPRIETSPEATKSVSPAATVPPMAPRERERAQRLMEKGDQELDNGNVSSARLFYEYAADAGLAEAAMALAATFDASELAKRNVRGIAPDAKEAQRWYERARELGAAEAQQRISRLGAQ